MCYDPYGSISKINPGRKSSTFEIMKKKKKKYTSILFPKDRKFYLIGHLAGTQLGELSSGTEQIMIHGSILKSVISRTIYF